MAIYPYIPQFITVHLGSPSQNARNVSIGFPDYIKNVASSEIYPTWPENALRANIYTQISFALNRVYTEWYRSRGYAFDITNSTQYDQAFIYGRDVFENISQIVDEIFNNYLRRPGTIEPFFSQFCNGTTVTCPGLSQWGSVTLANQGMTPYEILTYYYGEDLEIVRDAPVQSITESYPGIPLRIGSAGNDVRNVQLRLNRIGQNYPLIPRIQPVTGVYNEATANAVRQFQTLFDLTADGIVGKATWYRISYMYVSVKRLAELESEGIRLEDVSTQYQTTLQEGMTGEPIELLQYYLSGVGISNPEIPPVTIDGVFGPATTNAVISFQRMKGIPQDGIVGRVTWNLLYNDYLGVARALAPSQVPNGTVLYPGEVLTQGSQGQYVEYLQLFLNRIAQAYPSIPTVPVTGFYGTQTTEAVLAFQNYFGLRETGNVNLQTWEQVTRVYRELIESGNS